MKKHIFGMAMALTALGSQAALAANEGGDTWSELQPKPYASSHQSASGSAGLSSASAISSYPIAANEGGDTWSEVESRSYAEATQQLTVATTGSLSALLQPNDSNDSNDGTPAQVGAADRTVLLGADSESLNVEYGEIVAFTAQDASGADRSFAWRFDVSPALDYVDLSTVAPADFPHQNVRVFVAPDPEYTGG